MNILSALKQARKKTNLSLQDMARVINIDPSNLSKYERGTLIPPLQVTLYYHILTKTPLVRLFDNLIVKYADNLSYRLKNLIDDLSLENTTEKTQRQIANFGQLLENLTFLQEITDQGND